MPLRAPPDSPRPRPRPRPRAYVDILVVHTWMYSYARHAVHLYLSLFLHVNDILGFDEQQLCFGFEKLVSWYILFFELSIYTFQIDVNLSMFCIYSKERGLGFNSHRSFPAQKTKESEACLRPCINIQISRNDLILI